MIVLKQNQPFALQKLYDINCPMKTFEDYLTEEVMEKYLSDNYEFQYQICLLTTKFSNLRERELRKSQEKLTKN